MILGHILIRLLVIGAAFAVAAGLLDGMEVSGGFVTYLWIAAIFAVVNLVIGTILRVLASPLILLTLGLFAIVVNAIVLQITDGLTDRLTIDEFWWTAIWGAIIIAIVTVAIEAVIARVTKKPRRTA